MKHACVSKGFLQVLGKVSGASEEQPGEERGVGFGEGLSQDVFQAVLGGDGSSDNGVAFVGAAFLEFAAVPDA